MGQTVHTLFGSQRPSYDKLDSGLELLNSVQEQVKNEDHSHRGKNQSNKPDSQLMAEIDREQAILDLNP